MSGGRGSGFRLQHALGPSLLPPQSEPQQLWASGGPSVKPHCPRLLSLARGLSWQMTAKPGCQRTGRVWASPASLQTGRRVVPTCSPGGPTQGWSISQVTRHLQELLNFTKSSCPLSTPQGCSFFFFLRKKTSGSRASGMHVHCIFHVRGQGGFTASELAEGYKLQ